MIAVKSTLCVKPFLSIVLTNSILLFSFFVLILQQAGTELAAEKAQFESRLRRIKLACSRWKVSYQKDVHERYQAMTNVLEERYMRYEQVHPA